MNELISVALRRLLYLIPMSALVVVVMFLLDAFWSEQSSWPSLASFVLQALFYALLAVVLLPLFRYCKQRVAFIRFSEFAVVIVFSAALAILQNWIGYDGLPLLTLVTMSLLIGAPPRK